MIEERSVRAVRYWKERPAKYELMLEFGCGSEWVDGDFEDAARFATERGWKIVPMPSDAITMWAAEPEKWRVGGVQTLTGKIVQTERD